MAMSKDCVGYPVATPQHQACSQLSADFDSRRQRGPRTHDVERHRTTPRVRRSFPAVFKVPGSIMTDRSVCARFEANEDNAFARFDAMSFTANLGLSTLGTLVTSSARGGPDPGQCQ